MISLIVGLITLLLGIGVIIIAVLKELEILSPIATVIILCSMMCFICTIVGPNNHISEEEYLKLNFMAEHWDELSSYEQATVGKDITYWNKNLNNGNNYWFKFEIEDRSMYYIELEK